MSNAAINSEIIRYNNSAHMLMAAGSNFAFKIAAKPPLIEKWLLLTAYRNSSSPYTTVPSLTLSDIRFSHITCVTDRQPDKQRHIVPKA